MKKIVSLLLICLLVSGFALASLGDDQMHDIASMFNSGCADNDWYVSCTYIPESNAFAIILRLDASYDEFMSDNPALTRAEYTLWDSVFTDTLKDGGIDAAVVTLGLTEDNRPFFLCINGEDQSWMLDGV